MCIRERCVCVVCVSVCVRVRARARARACVCVCVGLGFLMKYTWGAFGLLMCAAPVFSGMLSPDALEEKLGCVCVCVCA